jgi:PleD family two-component response regulator
VRQLGGQLVLASENDTDALPIDVSLGEGPPMMATAEPLSVARMQLERTLPRLVEDARQAIGLLRQAESLTEQTNDDPLTGLANPRVLERVLPRIDGPDD